MKKGVGKKGLVIGIVICMLMATTVVSATYVNVKEHNQTAASSVDVPVWEIGDSWTYHEQYVYHKYQEESGRILNLWYHNCTSTYIITDAAGGNYTMKMTSTNNEGSQITSLWGKNFLINFLMNYTKFTILTGEFTLNKTDLSYFRSSYTESGFVWQGLLKLHLLKIPLFIPWHWNMSWVTLNTPSRIVFPFPLTAGTTGTLANYSWITDEVDWLLWGLIGPIHISYPQGHYGEQQYTCEMEEIAVPAGTYSTYNVTIESTGPPLVHELTCSYYSPEIGWMVKQYNNYQNETGKSGYTYKGELVSTTYTP